MNSVTSIDVEPTDPSACEPANDRDVGHVEQHLQYVGQHQRYAEQQDIAAERATGERDFLLTIHKYLATPECFESTFIARQVKCRARWHYTLKILWVN